MNRKIPLYTLYGVRGRAAGSIKLIAIQKA